MACALVCTLAACKALDEGLLTPPDEVKDASTDAAPPTKDAAPPGLDAGRDADVDGGTCTKGDETCNGKDDDCDDKVDEGGDTWCESIIKHAPAACEPNDGICYASDDCHEGFDSCDGDPANGCEADYCECNACDDAGTDDAGP